LSFDSRGVPLVTYVASRFNLPSTKVGSYLRLQSMDRWVDVAADQTADFNWVPIPGADRYEIRIVDRSSCWGSLVVRATDIAGTTYSLDAAHALIPGRSYIWYVTPIAADGKLGPRGAGHRFALPKLDAPVLSGPSGTIVIGPAFDLPTFKWYPVEGANRYTVTVVDLSGGKGQTGTTTDTLWTPGIPLSPGHRYRWRVTAISTNGRGITRSGFVKFDLAPLVAPTQLSPVGSATGQPQFGWSSVPGADRYLFRLIDRTTGKTLIKDQEVSGTTFVPGIQLTVGHRYRWQVAAVSTNGIIKVWSLRTEFDLT
jgi:hypothetical protein